MEYKFAELFDPITLKAGDHILLDPHTNGRLLIYRKASDGDYRLFTAIGLDSTYVEGSEISSKK